MIRRCFCIVIAAAGLSLLLFSCKSRTTSGRTEKHMAEIKYTTGTVLYADVINSKAIIASDTGDSSRTVFRSFKIGIRDSLVYDKKEEEAYSKYFNYTMQSDWVAMVNGDSARPVFFQPAVARDAHSKEGVLVFEVPAGTAPDTLVFTPSYRTHEQQLLVLNSNK